MAGLNAAGLELGAAGIAAGITFVQLHSATPDATGSNECACAREAVACTASGGVVTIPQTSFTGGTANGPVAAVGYWSALTGGTFYGYDDLAAGSDTSFNAAGDYTLNQSTITGSAT